MEKREEITLGLFDSISIGIKVVLSEIYWVILKALRQWEIKELKKRLDKEYITLGRLTINDPKNQKEIRVCKEQIKFLSNEVEFLEKDLSRIRKKIIKKREELFK